MMVFTDEDLKWLKEKDGPIVIYMTTEDRDALLARLEAAEKICYVLLNTRSINMAATWDNLEAWRKACGK